MQDAISRSREIVYGDDFTLMCMLDSIETHHFRHLVLAYACSFAISCSTSLSICPDSAISW